MPGRGRGLETVEEARAGVAEVAPGPEPSRADRPARAEILAPTSNSGAIRSERPSTRSVVGLERPYGNRVDVLELAPSPAPRRVVACAAERVSCTFSMRDNPLPIGLGGSGTGVPCDRT